MTFLINYLSTLALVSCDGCTYLVQRKGGWSKALIWTIWLWLSRIVHLV